MCIAVPKRQCICVTSRRLNLHVRRGLSVRERKIGKQREALYICIHMRSITDEIRYRATRTRLVAALVQWARATGFEGSHPSYVTRRFTLRQRPVRQISILLLVSSSFFRIAGSSFFYLPSPRWHPLALSCPFLSITSRGWSCAVSKIVRKSYFS